MQSDKAKKETITIIGAGLVGSLLSLLLAKRGYKVRMLERRVDMRKEAISAGRSINLAISTRGLIALAEVGMDDLVLQQAVPMLGRMMHARDGALTFQPYSKNPDEYINSVSRAALNKLLMTRAEATGQVEIFFQTRVDGCDFAAKRLQCFDESKGQSIELPYEITIGTDGSASRVRDALIKLPGYESDSSRLDYGYKELVILESNLEKNALHIWPRGNYMLIALPNFDGSFTCTLFLPFKGPVSFESLDSQDAVRDFLQAEFADAYALIPDAVQQYFANPTGHMDTVKCYPWHYAGDVLLLGDAAHAIVPFYGQGANCGFEDISVFESMLSQAEAKGRIDWQKLFADLGQERKPNCDAISDMAVDNFIEMRDKVGDAGFLLAKAVEKVLEREFPGDYQSRYSLVTFSNRPYKMAQDVGAACERVLGQLCVGLDDPERVDLARAKVLIDRELRPVIDRYRSSLTPLT